MEAHSEDSCWHWAIPTAFIHFFTVECLHIYLAVLSWWSLVVDVNVKVALLQHGISLGPFTSYYSDLYFKGSAKEVRVEFNDNSPVKLPAVSVMTHQTDVRDDVQQHRRVRAFLEERPPLARRSGSAGLLSPWPLLAEPGALVLADAEVLGPYPECRPRAPARADAHLRQHQPGAHAA